MAWAMSEQVAVIAAAVVAVLGGVATIMEARWGWVDAQSLRDELVGLRERVTRLEVLEKEDRQ